MIRVGAFGLCIAAATALDCAASHAPERPAQIAPVRALDAGTTVAAPDAAASDAVDAENGDDRVLAIVDGRPIRASDVERVRAGTLRQHGHAPGVASNNPERDEEADLEDTLSTLIVQTAMEVEAERLGHTVTDADIDRAFDNEMLVIGLSRSDAERLYLHAGLQREEVRAVVRRAAAADVLFSATHPELLTVTDDDLAWMNQVSYETTQDVAAHAPALTVVLRGAREGCLERFWIHTQLPTHSVQWLIPRQIADREWRDDDPAGVWIPPANVEIVGATALSVDAARRTLAMNYPSGVALRTDGRPASENVEALRRAFANQGYAAVQLDTPPIEGNVCVPEHGRLRITVHENARYRFGPLTVVESRGDARELLRRLRPAVRYHTRRGDWFSLTAVQSDGDALQHAFRDLGFAEMTWHESYSPHDDRIDVTLTLDVGPPVQITAIEIRGHSERWSDDQIRALIPLRVGHLYSETLYRRSVARLEATEGLEGARLRSERVPGATGQRILIVELPNAAPEHPAAAPSD